MDLSFQKTLENKTIAVIGCGGLGGNIANLVARLKPKKILLFDGDVFNESNMNRQLFASNLTLGQNKATVTKERLERISPSEVIAYEIFIDLDNAKLIKDADIIFGATDNVKSRFILQEIGAKYKIPVIHGAINGLFGEVGIIYPGDKTCERLYATKKEKKIYPTYSYVPACIASIQVAEAFKLLTNNNPLLTNELICVDLFTMELRKINI